MTSSNILLQDWDTPFGLPPFQAIRDEDFIPAFENAMKTHRAEIETIANDGNEPTFANTVEALERAGRALTKVANVFFNLSSADTNDTRQAIERDIGPKLAKHSMAIYTDPKLFERIDALAEKADTLGLDDEQRRLLERYHKRFIRAGAKLDAAGKARLTDINARLSELHTAFSQNVLAAEKAFQLVLDGEADLAGLPDFVREGAAKAAEERGLSGKHVITLSRASIEPFLEFSTRRDLREKAYRAYIARGEGGDDSPDNTPLISEILALRAELAKLLGFSTYAAYQIDDAMAKTPANARDLLEKVWAGAKRRADAEADALATLAQAEGHNEPLAAWDWHHYAEKRRKAEFDIDGAALKPYFELDAMIAAAFETAHRLFGLTFEERRDVPLYHPDVRAWTVKNRDGKPVALFVGDYFARTSKRSGAWMSDFREQSRIDGEVLPIIVNVLNFTKGGEGKPSLLSLDDVRTLFHEFGHGLHGMLSNVTYPGLSGTSVDRDFVELPSQLYENWALQPEILNRFARHVETGEPLPQAIVDKLHAARKFNQGFATAEYTASALYDLAIHEADGAGVTDPAAFEAELRAKLGMPDAIALRHRPPHFQHIFAGGGYAAGYYTYLWAEVMEADAFDAFEEAGSAFDPEVAERLHRFVYSSGGTLKPDEAYRAFRGRDPEVGPLLDKRGLTEDAAA
ncbi:M3 family metallopeptidase [Rhodomicrobium lacus]|uniref:M3 family metallopeptidase n=1 Tax=Rhodomicrobium lacus TaxID=2498452 RepID=UPI000F8C5489|nr:M3 family metallopeptidase [Rhodomicrobium lacus]